MRERDWGQYVVLVVSKRVHCADIDEFNMPFAGGNQFFRTQLPHHAVEMGTSGRGRGRNLL